MLSYSTDNEKCTSRKDLFLISRPINLLEILRKDCRPAILNYLHNNDLTVDFVKEYLKYDYSYVDLDDLYEFIEKNMESFVDVSNPKINYITSLIKYNTGKDLDESVYKTLITETGIPKPQELEDIYSILNSKVKKRIIHFYETNQLIYDKYRLTDDD